MPNVAKGSAMHMIEQYLDRRAHVLSQFHPEWDTMYIEVANNPAFLNQDGTPICIPPSWDLVHKYAGAYDERADGFNKKLFEEAKSPIIGDKGESEFLDVFRNTYKIGGVLIGDIDWCQLLYGEELAEADKTCYMLPNELCDIVRKVGRFQFDFVYFHPTIGIVHFEVKKGRKRKGETQLAKNREKLKQLFLAFCQLMKKENAENLWDKVFFRKSYIYRSKYKKKEHDQLQLPPTTTVSTTSSGYNRETNVMECDALVGMENLEKFVRKKQHEAMIKDVNQHIRGVIKSEVSPGTLEKICRELQISSPFDLPIFFKDEIFRKFLIFLAGYRPDFYISPVQCALKLRENIFSHQINVINFYKHKKGKQNESTTVNEFLATIPFLKHKTVDFGKYQNVYLTKRQKDAVGFFNGGENITPQRQLIVGPPGSGKSLVLMLKMFIIAQIPTRQTIKLFYSTYSTDHLIQIAEFIARNRSKFCRTVKELEYFSDEWEQASHKGADVILDEEVSGLDALACLCATENQIITVVCTGQHGMGVFDREIFESNGFTISELNSVFRSTVQIQRLFRLCNFDEEMRKKDLISGHNFDGVMAEAYTPGNEQQAMQILHQRIDRLINIEGCEPDDIGLLQPRNYEQPQWLNKSNVFTDCDNIRSLEFPVMIVVDQPAAHLYTAISRASCHLILFKIPKKRT